MSSRYLIDLKQRKSKIIHVYRNGDKYSRAALVLLRPVEQKELERIFRAVEEKITLPNSKPIKRMFTIEGDEIEKSWQVEDQTYYVVGSSENFIKTKYGTTRYWNILGPVRWSKCRNIIYEPPEPTDVHAGRTAVDHWRLGRSQSARSSTKMSKSLSAVPTYRKVARKDKKMAFSIDQARRPISQSSNDIDTGVIQDDTLSQEKKDSLEVSNSSPDALSLNSNRPAQRHHNNVTIDFKENKNDDIPVVEPTPTLDNEGNYAVVSDIADLSCHDEGDLEKDAFEAPSNLSVRPNIESKPPSEDKCDTDENASTKGEDEETAEENMNKFKERMEEISEDQSNESCSLGIERISGSKKDAEETFSLISEEVEEADEKVEFNRKNERNHGNEIVRNNNILAEDGQTDDEVSLLKEEEIVLMEKDPCNRETEGDTIEEIIPENDDKKVKIEEDPESDDSLLEKEKAALLIQANFRENLRNRFAKRKATPEAKPQGLVLEVVTVESKQEPDKESNKEVKIGESDDPAKKSEDIKLPQTAHTNDLIFEDNDLKKPSEERIDTSFDMGSKDEETLEDGMKGLEEDDERCDDECEYSDRSIEVTSNHGHGIHKNEERITEEVKSSSEKDEVEVDEHNEMYHSDECDPDDRFKTYIKHSNDYVDQEMIEEINLSEVENSSKEGCGKNLEYLPEEKEERLTDETKNLSEDFQDDMEEEIDNSDESEFQNDLKEGDKADSIPHPGYYEEETEDIKNSALKEQDVEFEEDENSHDSGEEKSDQDLQEEKKIEMSTDSEDYEDKDIEYEMKDHIHDPDEKKLQEELKEEENVERISNCEDKKENIKHNFSEDHNEEDEDQDQEDLKEEDNVERLSHCEDKEEDIKGDFSEDHNEKDEDQDQEDLKEEIVERIFHSEDKKKDIEYNSKENYNKKDVEQDQEDVKEEEIVERISCLKDEEDDIIDNSSEEKKDEEQDHSYDSEDATEDHLETSRSSIRNNKPLKNISDDEDKEFEEQVENSKMKDSVEIQKKEIDPNFESDEEEYKDDQRHNDTQALERLEHSLEEDIEDSLNKELKQQVSKEKEYLKESSENFRETNKSDLSEDDDEENNDNSELEDSKESGNILHDSQDYNNRSNKDESKECLHENIHSSEEVGRSLERDQIKHSSECGDENNFDEAEEQSSHLEEEKKAAVVIQSNFRGHLAREEFKNHRKDDPTNTFHNDKERDDEIIIDKEGILSNSFDSKSKGDNVCSSDDGKDGEKGDQDMILDEQKMPSESSEGMNSEGESKHNRDFEGELLTSPEEERSASNIPGEGNFDVKEHAAVIIQANFRGHLTRTALKGSSIAEGDYESGDDHDRNYEVHDSDDLEEDGTDSPLQNFKYNNDSNNRPQRNESYSDDAFIADNNG